LDEEVRKQLKPWEQELLRIYDKVQNEKDDSVRSKKRDKKPNLKSSTVSANCVKHNGLSLVYDTNIFRECPVCVKDEMIVLLDLKVRYSSSYFHWALDWLKILNYNGIDKAERERTIEKVNAELDNCKEELRRGVEILEEYEKIRKTYSW